MILNSPYISGSLTVTGNIIASGSITLSGSVASASFATSASNATNAISASYANNLTVAGTLTAQTLVVQTITSSVDFVTGSTRFGSLSSNTHVFTGSMYVTGALYVATGSVGIGTTSPISTLSVATTSNTSSLGSTGLTIGGVTTLTTGSVLMLNFTAIGADSARARAGIGCVVGSDWGTGNLTFYTRTATDASAMTTADERMRITSTGIIYNSNPPANDFAARFVGNTTTGQSFGLQVWGGTNSSDTAFRVLNASTSTEYFKIRGDGEVIVTQSVTAAAFSIPSANVAGSRQILSGENTNTGTTGKMRILLQNLSNSLLIEKYGTGYTTSGIATTAGSAIYDDGAGGMSIGATNGSGTLRLFAGNAEGMRIRADGIISLGTGYAAANSFNYFPIYSAGQPGFNLLSSTSTDLLSFNGNTKALFLGNLTGGATTLSTDASGNVIRTPSDINLKTNIEDLQYGLETIMQLRPIIHNWKESIDTEEKSINMGEGKSIGFIAQEVELLVPEIVCGDEYKSIDYPKMVAILTKAIQELSKQNDALQSRIETLESK